MGTRSTTSFYDGDNHLLTYYRQYDGYPTYYGSQLAEFIDNCEIVNGFTMAMKVVLMPTELVVWSLKF